MEKVFVRSPYNYDRDLASVESGLRCEDVTRTKQEFAEECDINTIVRRFGLTGVLPENLRVPTSGDFQDVDDFQTAMNAVVAARESFDTLPASIRSRFHNSPVELIAFLDDADNRAEAVKYGLIPRNATVEELEKARLAAPLTVGSLEKALAARAPVAAPGAAPGAA